MDKVRDKFGNIDKKQAGDILSGVQSELRSTLDLVETVEDLESKKSLSTETFKKIRKDLFGGISGIEALTKAIQIKLAQEFKAMIDKGTIESLDSVQNRFESLKNAAQNTETGLNPLANLDQDNIQAKIDSALKIKVSENIKQTIVRANLGTNPLTNLENALKPFLDRQKVGSKEGDEARELIRNLLDEAAKNLGNSNEDKAKKLMIARIIIKMKS